MEKAYLILKYNEVKNTLGHQPSKNEFCKNTNISERAIGKQFGANSWNKFVEECGDTPKVFYKEKVNIEEILIQYGNLFRELKRHPPANEWDFRNYSPTVSGITVVHKIKWSELPQKFMEYAFEKPEWQDVVDSIPNNNYASNLKIESDRHQTPKIQLNFIPPIVHDLVELSYNDNEALEFEKKVNIVFEMLGFEVKNLGQGTGRKPDGIALCKSNPRYAILIDSKSRSNGYKFGTDDRTFVEYIKTYINRLQNDGFDKLYFLVVSSKFTSIPDTSIKRLALETHVPISFITSNSLIKLLANKIERPRLFDLEKFRDLLIDNGEIFENEIGKFFQDIAKSFKL